ncbi:MAG: hypothetical protein ABI969_07870 [bacterium]
MRSQIVTGFLFALAIPLQQASAQKVLDFSDMTGVEWTHYYQPGFESGVFVGGTPYKGLLLGGFSIYVDGVNPAMGVGSWPLFLHSDVPFNFSSALFKSTASFDHAVSVIGFREGDFLHNLNTYTFGYDVPAYGKGFRVNSDDYTRVYFGWEDVTTVAIFNGYGHDAHSYVQDDLHVDDITLAPEPSSLTFLMSGLLAALGVRFVSRKKKRSTWAAARQIAGKASN